MAGGFPLLGGFVTVGCLGPRGPLRSNEKLSQRPIRRYGSKCPPQGGEQQPKRQAVFLLVQVIRQRDLGSCGGHLGLLLLPQWRNELLTEENSIAGHCNEGARVEHWGREEPVNECGYCRERVQAWDDAQDRSPPPQGVPRE